MILSLSWSVDGNVTDKNQQSSRRICGRLRNVIICERDAILPTIGTKTMNLTPSLSRCFIPTVLAAIAALAVPSATRAQTPSDQAKTAGAIPLSIELLDKIDKFTKAVNSDAATTAEWNASSKDPAISSETPAVIINSKYPKLAAAFKSADLAPEDFVKAYGAILVTGVIAEVGTPMADKNAEANITFYKANKDRVTATMSSLDALDKGADSPSPAAPSVSPGASP
jgi:hypothetical protein